MLKTRFNRLLIGFIAALPLIGTLPHQMLAQSVEGRDDGSDHRDFLLSRANCLKTSSNSNYRLSNKTESVSINRQIYTSFFAVGAPGRSGNSSLSCSVDPADFGTLDLQIGVDDESVSNEARMTVNIYQGSNLKYRYDNVRGGTLINVLLVLDGPEVSGGQSNFAIEISD